ncbi:hypothetical protein [Thermasporomyces composti]|uniref:Uncharacterized protein n=1 Tax=Thermasporomyces composti TaxID=696763 RepID=A0A3D9V8S5_THECX|nr:hypothetical protein [Thermasporomyces composti]REF38188.1 hypothetical protein DFJ64_3659 [Thermasporomyces composti]
MIILVIAVVVVLVGAVVAWFALGHSLEERGPSSTGAVIPFDAQGLLDNG